MTVGTCVIIMGMLLLVFCGIVFIGIPYGENIGLIISIYGPVAVLIILLLLLIVYIIWTSVTWLGKHWNDKLFEKKNKNRK